MMKRLKNIKGFTLVELLVVISIIGILIAVSLFGLQGARESGRDTKRKADIELIRSGLELYKADCNVYPLTPYPRTYTNNWPATVVGSGTPTTCSAANTYFTPPTDPTGSTRYYRYYSAGGTSYELCVSLEATGLATVTCGGSSTCGTSATCNYKVTNP